jgi:hypothetical protein
LPPAPEEGLRAEERDDAGFLALDDDAVLRVLDEREDAGLEAVLRAVDDREDAGFDADDELDLRAFDEAGLGAVEADERVEPALEAEDVPRRREVVPPVVRLALARLDAAGPLSGPTSSAATRLARPSTSVRRPLSSSSTRSSSTSRMRLAAVVTSFARPRVDLAPSAEAVKVRSTAARTASTASAAPAAALSFLPFFFESFLAMAARS